MKINEKVLDQLLQAQRGRSPGIEMSRGRRSWISLIRMRLGQHEGGGVHRGPSVDLRTLKGLLPSEVPSVQRVEVSTPGIVPFSLFSLFCPFSVWASILASLVFSLVGCATVGRIDRILVRDVMNDLVFVGSGQAGLVDDVLSSGVSHGVDPEPSPEVLDVGFAYVFHREEPTDTEELGLQVFPARLERSNFVLTKYPRSVSDLVVAFLGGPYFKIEFQNRGSRFVLRSHRCDGDNRNLEEGDGWSESDFVLTRLEDAPSQGD